MITNDNANCTTINVFLKPLLPKSLMLDKFFKTSTGLKDDKAQAGNAPASNPVNKLKPINQLNNLKSNVTSGGISSLLNGE